MKQFKEAQLVMLPTNNRSHIYHVKQNNTLASVSGIVESDLDQFPNQTNTQNQHLYVFSKDKIKEGNYVYDRYKNSVYLATKVVIHNMVSLDYEQYLNKVIATSDTSLLLKAIEGEDRYKYPQLPKSFIKIFIDTYNKNYIDPHNTTIIDVLVEYEEYILQYLNNPQESLLRPKVNPKDNTITIKELKDSWNREEVIELLKITWEEADSQYDRNDYIYNGENEIQTITYLEKDMNKWIAENL